MLTLTTILPSLTTMSAYELELLVKAAAEQKEKTEAAELKRQEEIKLNAEKALKLAKLKKIKEDPSLASWVFLYRFYEDKITTGDKHIREVEEQITVTIKIKQKIDPYEFCRNNYNMKKLLELNDDVTLNNDDWNLAYPRLVDTKHEIVGWQTACHNDADGSVQSKRISLWLKDMIAKHLDESDTGTTTPSIIESDFAISGQIVLLTSKLKEWDVDIESLLDIDAAIQKLASNS